MKSALITAYFEEVKARLLLSPAALSFKITNEKLGQDEGKIRIKVVLVNGDVLELFVYVLEIKNEIQLSKYSFHWQDRQGKLKKRWDNSPHFPELANFPHHIHLRNGSVQEAKKIPNIFAVIEEIEKMLT